MSADPAPIPTAALIMRRAQSYLSRRAASAVQLRVYLLRKFRAPGTRDADAEVAQHVDGVVARLVEAGYLNDLLLARSRAAGLAAKGLPASHVALRLRHQGLSFVNDSSNPTVADDESQARRFAERKRLGPLASGRRPASHERDMRALLRAGFSIEIASKVLRDLSSEHGASDPGDTRRMNTG